MPELLAVPPKWELCLEEPLSLRCRQLPDWERFEPERADRRTANGSKERKQR
nr:MAG TPA: hypothetical protein [Caudoviricetes sp.]DAX03448.1 MAG TPA: hypothetical protein [Bacteriophage sp.]